MISALKPCKDINNSLAKTWSLTIPITSSTFGSESKSRFMSSKDFGIWPQPLDQESRQISMLQISVKKRAVCEIWLRLLFTNKLHAKIALGLLRFAARSRASLVKCYDSWIKKCILCIIMLVSSRLFESFTFRQREILFPPEQLSFHSNCLRFAANL